MHRSTLAQPHAGSHSSIHPFIHPSIHPIHPIHPIHRIHRIHPIHPFHPLSSLSSLSSTRPLVHSSIRPFVHSSIRPFVHSFIRSFVHSSLHPSIHPFVHPFIHPSISESVRAPRTARSTTRACSHTSLCCSCLSNAQKERQEDVGICPCHSSSLLRGSRRLFPRDLLRPYEVSNQLVEPGTGRTGLGPMGLRGIVCMVFFFCFPFFFTVFLACFSYDPSCSQSSEVFCRVTGTGHLRRPVSSTLRCDVTSYLVVTLLLMAFHSVHITWMTRTPIPCMEGETLAPELRADTKFAVREDGPAIMGF